jgi:DNA invertase Pin-like site-specific DNA recombinase
MASRISENPTTISVHPDDIDAVQAFMESLIITRSASVEPHVEIDIMEDAVFDEKTAEVVKVVSHRNSNTDWDFLVKFKGDRNEYWVKDKDCNCESLIKEYLSKKCPLVRTAFCFCRVSSKSQVGETHVSLEAQEAELVTKASTNYARVKLYKISGSAYKNMPKALAGIGEGCGEGDAILIYRVDRLSRNIIKYLSWMEDLDTKKVVICSVSDNLVYKSNKLEFIEAIVGAQKESALLSSRVRMSIARRKARGDEGVGCLPYGKMYKRTETGTLKIVDNLYERSIVSRIRSLSQTAIPNSHISPNPREIASILNAEGIKKKGRNWSESMVARILTI